MPTKINDSFFPRYTRPPIAKNTSNENFPLNNPCQSLPAKISRPVQDRTVSRQIAAVRQSLRFATALCPHQDFDSSPTLFAITGADDFFRPFDRLKIYLLDLFIRGCQTAQTFIMLCPVRLFIRNHGIQYETQYPRPVLQGRGHLFRHRQLVQNLLHGSVQQSIHQ